MLMKCVDGFGKECVDAVHGRSVPFLDSMGQKSFINSANEATAAYKISRPLKPNMAMGIKDVGWQERRKLAFEKLVVDRTSNSLRSQRGRSYEIKHSFFNSPCITQPAIISLSPATLIWYLRHFAVFYAG